MRFLISLWETLSLILDFTWKVGVSMGVFIYEYLGIQTHFIGWTIVLIAEFLAWNTFGLDGFWSAIYPVNLALVSLACIYFQMFDKGCKTSSESPEVFIIHMVPDHFRVGGVLSLIAGWVNLSMNWHSWIVGSNIITLLVFREPVLVAFNVLASISIALMSLKFEGGTKGKVWEKLGKVLEMRGGILPRPSLG